MDQSKNCFAQAVSDMLLDHVLTKDLLVCIIFLFGENFEADSKKTNYGPNFTCSKISSSTIYQLLSKTCWMIGSVDPDEM